MANQSNPGFTSSNVGAIAPCALKTTPNQPDKNQRYKDRLDLINKGKQSKNPQVVEAAERLEKDNKAVERARLSDDVYYADGTPPPIDYKKPEGWHQLNDQELKDLGFSHGQKDLIDPKTGLKAAIYRSEFELPKPPKTIIAFAGTDDKQDVLVDAAQSVGLRTKQYSQAMEISNTVCTKLGSKNVEVTGHSMGGGLAAASSVTTQCGATTFNAAGLNANTVKDLGIEKETMMLRSKNIEAYNSSNDPLTAVQENRNLIKGAIISSVIASGGVNALPLVAPIADPDSIPIAIGNKHEIQPAPKNQLTWKQKILHPINSAITGHSSSNMVDNIEYEKTQDERQIGKSIGLIGTGSSGSW